MANPSHHETATGYPLPHNPATGDAAYHIAIPPPPPTGYKLFLDDRRRRIVGAIIILLSLSGLFYLLFPLNDNNDNTHFPDFRVDSASLTLVNATGPVIPATWDITLIVTNPNRKADLSYDTVSTRVFYGEKDDIILASTDLPPFYQKRQNETILRPHLVVDNFVDNSVANSIVADRVSGSVQFGVTFLALIRIQTSEFITFGQLKVNCYNVTFVFSPNNATGALMRGLQCDWKHFRSLKEY